MSEFEGLGKMLLVMGGFLMLAGLVVLLLERSGAEDGPLGQWFGWFGKLPGDISIKRDGFSFYFPLTTSIVISVILSLLAYFLSKR
jgi:formate hydrogenlyase subunit 3/multisubunit Na+/H+ antiporter MnhD subunit